MFLEISFLPIVVVALLSVAVGSIWYSPLLFEGVWIRSREIDAEKAEFSRRELYRATCVALITQSIFFGIVSWLHTQMSGGSLIAIAGSMWILITTFLIDIAVWEKRPYAYVFVHAGYALITLLCGTGVILYWPW